MKNIQKLSLALSFIALSSVACSSVSTEETPSNLSSTTEKTVISGEEVSSNTKPNMEKTVALEEEISPNAESNVEEAMISSEEVSSNAESNVEEAMIAGEEVSSNAESNVEEAIALSEEASSNIATIIENPVVGTKVTLRGNIIEQMEDCYIFSDGQNKIMVHFEEELLSYDPDAVVEISGTVEEGMIDDSDHLATKEIHNDLSNTMIMVNEMEVIASSKN